MKRVLLACVAAGLIPASLVVGDETDSDSAVLTGLKSAFYQAVEKEVRRKHARDEGDEEESRVVRAMREEDEDDEDEDDDEHAGCPCEQCCQTCAACREHHRRGHIGPHPGIPHHGHPAIVGQPPHAPPAFDHLLHALPGFAPHLAPGHNPPQIVYVIVGGQAFGGQAFGGPWPTVHHAPPGRRPGAEFERRRSKRHARMDDEEEDEDDDEEEGEEEEEDDDEDRRRQARAAAELNEQMEMLHRQMRVNEAQAREMQELHEQLERLHGEVRELAEILRDMRRER